ncbi:hypothetical protein NQ176_g11332 [Zarea fungicola]|uniref:Uncharacterized protein n=1 Tax=Zarea fungicola TaxID=93591 RepID=A0ACC1MC62_9HYPO|nr:hypothetical protein NQ176_g11332 [Lecanicillium fungicola]
MASSDPRFDDSSDEEDFNPAPADMSDEEPEQRREQKRRKSPVHDDEEEEEQNTSPARPKHLDDDDEDEDEEEEEDGGKGRNDDDEEEEEDDDDEDDVQRGHRRKRRRDRRNAFLDIEAEVDDEDEAEDDEKEDEEIGDFIDNEHPDDLADTARLNDDRRHRELDRRRDMESSLDAEKQAELYRQRYAKYRSGKGTGESAVVPKRLLLPSVDDPGIWAVRCKEGKEREVVFSIMKRIEERMGSKGELAITAAFEPPD